MRPGPIQVVTLRAGPLEARFVPTVGMVGASLRRGGREVLGQRGGLEAYASRGSTFGIPLLHPWANRLGGFTYEAGGVQGVLDAASPRVRTEEHGLPIHGLLAGDRGWRVLEATERRLSAERAWTDDDLLALFPFPHVLRIDADLTAEALTVTTTLTPASDRAVPVAFGFHPYFTLPDVGREDVVLRHGPMTHVLLDGRGLPAGSTAPQPARDAPLGDAAYDDLYAGVGDGTEVALTGGGRELTLTLLEGYTHLQLFAPPGAAAVAIEPMTAPTDALRSGDGLRLADAPFTAAFAVAVRDVR